MQIEWVRMWVAQTQLFTDPAKVSDLIALAVGDEAVGQTDAVLHPS